MNRGIDKLGRLVIPKEMRKQLGLENGDKVNFECKDNKIIITNPNNENIDYKSRIDEALKYMKLNSKIDCEDTTSLIRFYNQLLIILGGEK